MAVRTSTLAEVKAISLATYIAENPGSSVEDILPEGGSGGLFSHLGNGDLSVVKDAFQTVGLARSLRIEEDYGTQNYYGIGSPTRPRIVPNNYQVTVTAERLQLDTRDLNNYVASPEFWYSDQFQRQIGIDDFLLYTYFFVKSKEEGDDGDYDIFALMPRSSSKAVTSGDVMIANNVSMVGFKYSYEQAFFDLSNLSDDTITRTSTTAGGGSAGDGTAPSRGTEQEFTP